MRAHYLEIIGQAGLSLSLFKKILGFGCGVGRFLFSISQELAQDQELCGCDVSERFIEFCQNQILFAQTNKSKIEPPLAYASEMFSLVYACSVYSHLPIEFQLKWAQEMYRITAPGGCLFMSTHGPAYFPVMHQARQANTFSKSSILSVDSTGLFMCCEISSVSGLGQLEFASAHNRTAVEHIFPFFDCRLYIPTSQIAASQDVYVLVKRPDAGGLVDAKQCMEGSEDAQSVIFEYQAELSG